MEKNSKLTISTQSILTTFIYLAIAILFVYILNHSYINVTQLLTVESNVVVGHYIIVACALVVSSTIINLVFDYIKWKKLTNRSFVLTKSLLITFFVSIFIYSHIFVLYFLKEIGSNYIEHYAYGIQFLKNESLVLLLLTFIFSFLMNILIFISQVIDSKFLINMLCNRYQKPKKEERVIMYLDLNDSTPIAEKLGNEKFVSFEQDFFKDIALAIKITSGKICQYIGDEIILTWTYKEAKRNGNALSVFWHIKDAIKKRENYYLETYDLVPKFKASIHCGSLLFGVFGLNRVITSYCGSILNEGARIIGECHNLEQELLISNEAKELLGDSKELEFLDYGKYDLKGVQHQIQIYGIKKLLNNFSKETDKDIFKKTLSENENLFPIT